MATRFKEVRKLQGERVRMQFDDGREVVAVLLCATTDIDGSRHLIYDMVESVNGAETIRAGTSTSIYADAKTLVGIEAADSQTMAHAPRGWDYVDLSRCA